MNREDAAAAVRSSAEVVARYGTGAEMGRGRVIGYSIVPTLTIEREDGTRFSWRHDMVDPITAAERVVERLDALPQEEHRRGIEVARERRRQRIIRAHDAHRRLVEDGQP